MIRQAVMSELKRSEYWCCQGARFRPLATVALALIISVSSSVGVRGESAGHASPSTSNANQVVLLIDNELLDRLFGHQRTAKAQPAAESEARPLEQTVRPAPLLKPDESFTARLNAGLAPRTAAVLRKAEQARQHLLKGAYLKALAGFERALDLGPERYQPYVYFYLAKVHFGLGGRAAARNFLIIAQSWLDYDPQWALHMARLLAAVGGD